MRYNSYKHRCHLVTVHKYQVKSLVVAREMVVPMASAAKAAREANGLVILQKGEAKCLEKIRCSKGLDESLY